MERRLDVEPGDVPGRALEHRVALGHHEERRARLDAERPEPRGQDLGARLRQADVGDHRYAARGDARGQRLPQGRAAHLGGHALVVAPGRRAERLATALPLRGADGALPGAAGPLLLPWLPAPAGDLAAPFGVVGAGAARGELAHDGLVHERNAHRHGEGCGQLEGGLALAVEHGNGRHAHLPSLAFCCWALVCFTLFRTTTRPPLAPGIAPRSRRRFCSGITRTTGRFSTVRRSPPIRPGSRWPGHTLDGSDDAPMEPGARWNIEPWVASPPDQPWRLTPP